MGTGKFKMHMETVHEIYLDLDFLLSIHFIKEEEKTSMVKATIRRMLASVGVQVGAGGESEAAVGELVFVPRGWRVVANGFQSDKMVGVGEDKGQVVEVLDDTEVTQGPPPVMVKLTAVHYGFDNDIFPKDFKPKTIAIDAEKPSTAEKEANVEKTSIVSIPKSSSGRVRKSL